MQSCKLAITVRISGVIITHNEEKNIGRCLTSMKDVCDEIIVVDSLSSDKTEDICRSFGVKFVSQAFLGYSGQKNFGNSLAENDFILSLDADEELSEELIKDIKRIKINPAADAYFFRRVTSYCGKWIRHCGWYPDYKLRLWNRNKGQWNGAIIHEDVSLSEGVNPVYINSEIKHYSFISISDHLSQINKFTDLLAQRDHGRGKKTNIIEILFKPFFKFIHLYFLKLGMLDGYYGFVVSSLSAYAAFLKLVKLNELNKRK